MTMQTVQYPRGKSIGAGIAGGIAGGAAMYGIMSALMTSLGMGPNCFAIIMGMITGQSYEAATGPGLAAHFGTSIAIGAIFGVVVSTKKLQLTGFPKGIGLGIATGVIAYVVIFLPIATTVMPSHIMDLMKMVPMGKMAGNMQGKGAMDQKMQMEEMQKMMMEQMQKIIPSILGGALVGHIVYGAVLGAVATAIVRTSRK